jgi:hypothetical protein
MNSKIELIKEILQIIDTLTPMEVKTIPENVVLKLYQLKKRVKELDPSWEFNDPYNHYIFRILILLDALEVDETFSLEKHGKICQMMHREVRDIRRINSSWRMNTSLVVEFINSTPLKEEEREREKDKLPENLVDKEDLSPFKSFKKKKKLRVYKSIK